MKLFVLLIKGKLDKSSETKVDESFPLSQFTINGDW